MKKLVVLLALVIISCNKKETVSVKPSVSDSATFQKSLVSDSGKGVTTTEAQTATLGLNAFRTVEDRKIVKTINADMIPLTLSDEFTDQQQEYVIKIENFGGQNITGEIYPENPEMNIRFNQIRLPNGEFDGPFGREIFYKTRDNGEIWLIIGKSNMASGVTAGKFSVNIK